MNRDIIIEFLKMIGFGYSGFAHLSGNYELAKWWRRNSKAIYNQIPHSRIHVEALRFWQRTSADADYFVTLGIPEE